MLWWQVFCTNIFIYFCKVLGCSGFTSFYNHMLIVVSGIPIHRDTVATLNIHWANHNPKVITNLDYNFFYIMVWHWTRNTVNFYITLPTVLLSLSLIFFKYYNFWFCSCVKALACFMLTTDFLIQRHQICNRGW